MKTKAIMLFLFLSTLSAYSQQKRSELEQKRADLVEQDFFGDPFKAVASASDSIVVYENGIARSVKKYYTCADERTFVNGLIRFEEKGKVGFADSLGNVVIPAIYAHVLPFYQDITIYSSGGSRRCLRKGVRLEDCGYDIEWNSWGEWGFIDRNNDTLIPPRQKDIDLQYWDLMTLTETRPTSTSYIALEGKARTYYVENVLKRFELFLDTFLTEVENGNTAFIESVCFPKLSCPPCLLNTR